jgi:metal-dependent hydrolase (beta-lactamase superfamily II)
MLGRNAIIQGANTMWHLEVKGTKTKASLLTPHLGFLSVLKLRWAARSFALILLIPFHLPNTGWAQENYYQIINGSVEAVNDNFINDRGYSVYFSYDGKKFLLDTGDNVSSFVDNMKTAGISSEELDFVALSHSHKDHTSGWPHLRKQRPQLPIHIPPGKVFSYSAEFNVVNDYLEITPNITLLHTHDESASLGIKDELSLLIRTGSGPYLFTTNSHTDFIMKLEKAKRVLGEGIFFHSGHIARRISPNDQILATVNKMKEMYVKKVSPSDSHPNHDNFFQQVFGTDYVPAILGKKVPLDLPK